MGDTEIMQPGRAYIRDGTLTKVCRKDRKKRHFFLFNDVLLYSYEMPNKHYKFGREFPLSTVRLKDLPDNEGRKLYHAFQISSESKSFIVYAATPEEKKEWLDAITKSMACLDQRAKTFQNSTKKGKRLSTMAPVWVPDSEAKTCTVCGGKFTFTNRRHHCRQCGCLVCGTCSNYKKFLPGQGKSKQRVCEKCKSKPIEAFESGVLMRPENATKGINTTAANGTLHVPQEVDGLSASSDESDEEITFIDQEVAKFDYSPPETPVVNVSARKLGFKAGQTLNIIQKDDSGWWLAELSGDTGWVPASFF